MVWPQNHRRPVWWFGPQNHRWRVSPGLGLKTQAEVLTWNGRHVAASGRLRGSKATDEEARWPSDQIIPSRTELALGLCLSSKCI